MRTSQNVLKGFLMSYEPGPGTLSSRSALAFLRASSIFARLAARQEEATRRVRGSAHLETGAKVIGHSRPPPVSVAPTAQGEIATAIMTGADTDARETPIGGANTATAMQTLPTRRNP